MNDIKTYKGPTHTYTITDINSTQVDGHCDAYFNYISLANNTNFLESEIEDLRTKMNSTAVSYCVYRDGVEMGYLYLLKVSAQQHYISVLHTFDEDRDPIPKLLLMQEVYTSYPEARYYPKDVYTMQNVSLLDPMSYRAFRFGLAEYIKLRPALWDNSLLTYLDLV